VRRGQKTPICLHVGMGVAGLSDVKYNAATQCGLLQVICINGAIGAWVCIVHAGRVASITGPINMQELFGPCRIDLSRTKGAWMATPHTHEHSHQDVTHTHTHLKHDHDHVEHAHDHNHNGQSHEHSHVHDSTFADAHDHGH
jgi:hypothetical protein